MLKCCADCQGGHRNPEENEDEHWLKYREDAASQEEPQSSSNGAEQVVYREWIVLGHLGSNSWILTKIWSELLTCVFKVLKNNLDRNLQRKYMHSDYSLSPNRIVGSSSLLWQNFWKKSADAKWLGYKYFKKIVTIRNQLLNFLQFSWKTNFKSYFKRKIRTSFFIDNCVWILVSNS